jgi:hypothetical protein
MVCVGGHAFDAIEQDFLERLNIGIFAADAALSAGFTSGNLFALVTEHGIPWGGLRNAASTVSSGRLTLHWGRITALIVE